MKYVWIGLSVVTLFFAGIFLLLFTHWGNSFVKPYIEDILEKKLQKKVTVESFTFKTSFIDLEVVIEDELKAIINGEFDLWKKSFDIDYEVDADSLQTPYIDINTPLHVKGAITGHLQRLQLSGEGRAFRSDINFVTQIDNNEVESIKADAKSLKIEDVLSFLKKPVYTRGIFDLHVDAKRESAKNYVGDADILIHHGTLVADVLQEEFGLNLLHSVAFRGKIEADIAGEKIKAISDITSNIAKIQTQKTEYDIKKKSLYSDYKLHLLNLETIGSMFDVPMQGDILLEGNIKQEGDDLAVDAVSNFVEGKLKAILFNDTLKLTGEALDISQLTWTLKQPKYSNGKLYLEGDFDEIRTKTPKGDIKLFTKDANLYGKELRRLTAQDFPSLLPYDLVADATLKEEGAFFESTFTSQIANLALKNSKATLDGKNIEGEYTLHVRDLNDLYFLTKKPMRGELKVDGEYALKEGELILDGQSDVFDAKSSFTLKQNNLHVSSEELAITKLTEALFYPRVFDAFASLQMDYNLQAKEGAFVVNAINGKMLENELTRLLLLVSKFDMTEEIFKENTLKGMIKQDDVDFSMAMNGMESYLHIPKGYVNLKNKKIDSDFSVKIEHRDFEGSITGSLDKPKVELDSSEYIKHKLDKAIDKNVPEDLKEPVKELLKLFG